MLLFKTVIIEDPVQGHININKIRLKLIGKGNEAWENGYEIICDKSCKKPLCGNYAAGKCKIKDQLIKNWKSRAN